MSEKKRKPAAPKRRGGRKPGTWRSDLSPGVLREWRTSNGISRGRLARAVGVSSTSIQNWEIGHVIPLATTQASLVETMKRPEALGNAPNMKSSKGEGAQSLESAVVTATGAIVAAMIVAKRKEAANVGELIASVRAGLVAR